MDGFKLWVGIYIVDTKQQFHVWHFVINIFITGSFAIQVWSLAGKLLTDVKFIRQPNLLPIISYWRPLAGLHFKPESQY